MCAPARDAYTTCRTQNVPNNTTYSLVYEKRCLCCHFHSSMSIIKRTQTTESRRHRRHQSLHPIFQRQVDLCESYAFMWIWTIRMHILHIEYGAHAFEYDCITCRRCRCLTCAAHLAIIVGKCGRCALDVRSGKVIAAGDCVLFVCFDITFPKITSENKTKTNSRSGWAQILLDSHT